LPRSFTTSAVREQAQAESASLKLIHWDDVVDSWVEVNDQHIDKAGIPLAQQHLRPSVLHRIPARFDLHPERLLVAGCNQVNSSPI